MIDVIEAVLKGMAMGLLLVISVGPVVFTVIKQSINNGKAGGFSFVAGVWISDFLLVVLSNLFSELVTMILDFKMQIGITGSVFLIGMGLYYIFFKKVYPSRRNVNPAKKQRSRKNRLTRFSAQYLNPAVIAFWLTTATAIAVSHTVRDRIIIFATTLFLILQRT